MLANKARPTHKAVSHQKITRSNDGGEWVLARGRLKCSPLAKPERVRALHTEGQQCWDGFMPTVLDFKGFYPGVDHILCLSVGWNERKKCDSMSLLGIAPRSSQSSVDCGQRFQCALFHIAQTKYLVSHRRPSCAGRYQKNMLVGKKKGPTSITCSAARPPVC